MDITLTDMDRESLHPLIQTYERRIRETTEMAKKAMIEVKKLRDFLSQLKYAEVKMSSHTKDDVLEYAPRSSRKMNFDAGFSSSWSLAKKIQYILIKHGKDQCLTSKEITDELMILEPTLDRVKTVKNVSTILSIGNGKGFKRIDNPNDTRKRRDYLYSLN